MGCSQRAAHTDDCIGKEKSQSSTELQPASVPATQLHGAPRSLGQQHGEKARDMPENPEEPGHRTTRGVQVLHEATRGLPQPSNANCILGSWALAMPSRWVSTSAQRNQCQGTGIRTGNQHISNFSFGQVIWDWKFPFSPELEI